MMKKIFPAPLLSVALFVIWLLLNQSLSAGHLLLALILALLLPVLFRGLRPRHVRVRNLGAILRLCTAVVVDTTVSNFAVMRFLVRPSARRHPSRFVQIPLELRDPNGLAVLAMIVCLTPGTAWAELSLDRSVLMLHVLEVGDPQEVIDHVKAKFERPLMEIFE
ncbi:Na+/H+ antiporter subunit E [Diaphorobacter aerolatus]|uniref:Na+/H+ antiporter subunit E n=1 Tax=Diaphorobacter aerolatus TaxID=1288495 RepID=A0A7H0GQ27_9BURK|nr:Na+/H+ antiporter subunit E [Diaphorobacter aerolatus]QNP50393.1 Na+/H+ antiporter subunit E [Diaphorobacter aerolatus]